MSRALIYISTLFIAHATYSAYEFISSTKRASGLTGASMPLDVSTPLVTIDKLTFEITAELFVAVVCFSIGTILTANKAPLKTVQRHAWAATQPTRQDDRFGFVDIVKLRRDYKARQGTKVAQ